MHKKKIKKLNSRLLCGIGAVVVAFSLMVGGVFAWADSSQYKSNVITSNQNIWDDVVLVEDFERPDNWQLNGELRKEVSVKNTGESQIYVRLQLKEYMEIAEAEYVYSDEQLLTDESGKFVSGETSDELKAWLDSHNIAYFDMQIKQYTAYGESVEKYYLKVDTNGKKLLLDYIEGAPESLVPSVSRAGFETTDNHQLSPVGECLYTPHLWNGATLAGGKSDDPDQDPFHEYVEWTLGAPLVKLSEWDGQPVAAWVLDDTGSDGWAYWGEALNPRYSTAKLLKSIKLIKQPAGPFYYALHVDMQAVDIDQLTSGFIGIPQKLEDSYRGNIGFAIKPDVRTVAPSGKVNFTAVWNNAAVPSGTVTWQVTKGTVPDIDALTVCDASGVLTIGQAQSLGTLIVTAVYNGPEGTKTRQYVIAVKPAAST